MKVLIVCSGNSGHISPFIKEQAAALEKFGVSINFFLVKGKGARGYLENIPKLKKLVNAFNPDLVHAHYGLSGLLGVLQRQVPVIITFHGSDINIHQNKKYSYVAARMSKHNIFVHELLSYKIRYFKANKHIIPCGVDIDIFRPIDKDEAKNIIGLRADKRYSLFSSSFDNPVKNYRLAREALNTIKIGSDVELIELKGYTRGEVSLLMNACDFVLLTSFREGSPQFIKEAMACNCPIVAVDVGDVKWVVGDTAGCYVTELEPKDVANNIVHALNFADKSSRTRGRNRLIELGLDTDSIACRLISLYQSIIKNS